MIVPFLLLLGSLSIVALEFPTTSPGLSDLLLLGSIMALASFALLVIAWLKSGQSAGDQPRPKKQPSAKKHAKPQRNILVDGSNVMHWKNETPELQTVHDVLAILTKRGFNPGVVFDANVGYKIGSRYLDDAELARMLFLPTDRVLVVPKGTIADKVLLQSARDLRARVVTNDRFRDWAADYPEVANPGFLIHGGFRDGKFWLDEVPELAI